MSIEILDAHYKKTGYLYLILLFLQILFFSVSLILVPNEIGDRKVSNDIFRFIVPIAGIIAMTLSNKMYKAKISKIQVKESIEVKLKKFRAYKLLQWFLIMTVGIFALAVFIFTKDYLYVVIFLFMMGYFILLRPTKHQLKTDIKI